MISVTAAALPLPLQTMPDARVPRQLCLHTHDAAEAVHIIECLWCTGGAKPDREIPKLRVMIALIVPQEQHSLMHAQTCLEWSERQSLWLSTTHNKRKTATWKLLSIHALQQLQCGCFPSSWRRFVRTVFTCPLSARRIRSSVALSQLC